MCKILFYFIQQFWNYFVQIIYYAYKTSGNLKKRLTGGVAYHELF